MSCSTSRGINDNRSTVQILTNRIFDNVREDYDRESFELSTVIPYELSEITPLYASGTGTFSAGRVLSVSQRYNGNNVDVSGNIPLSGILTYIYNGASYNAQCTITVPFSARMVIPDNSLWPFDFTVHYSFFADNITLQNDSLISFVDGTLICYVTSTMPVSVLYAGQIEYNSVSSREIQPQNTFMYSAFYPATSNL